MFTHMCMFCEPFENKLQTLQHFNPRSAGMQNGPSGRCAHSECVSQLRDPKLKKPQSFIMGCKQTYLTFALFLGFIFIIFIMLDIVILEGKQTYPLFQRGHYHCLPRLFASQTTLKRQFRTKVISVFSCKMGRSIKDPWRICLSTRM